MDHFSASSSAFSKPILPSSSSLISPKPPLLFPPPLSPFSLTPPDPSRYRECLRNHAAGLGGHVIDGCGEFMPSGFSDPLKCAACGCHRSFHRKDPPDASTATTTDYTNVDRIMLINAAAVAAAAAAGGGGQEDTSNITTTRCGGGRRGNSKKRFRTKFSDGQKEMMKGFAERVGWRVMKKDEGEMERFCAEVGVTRRVLKVWMHNNKHLSSAKKQDHGVLQNSYHEEDREVKVEGIMQQQYYE